MMEFFDPPWENIVWRKEAYAWIENALAVRGLRLTGPPDQFHIRPWATVLRLATTGGKFFFKAAAPNQAFEPALLLRLYELDPTLSLQVIAANKARGWVLLPDGGPTLRQALGSQVDVEIWKQFLRAYALMQIDLVSRTDTLLAAGLPDRRLETLPILFDELAAAADLRLFVREGGLSQRMVARFLAMRSNLETWCAQLAAFGLPASLEHGDLHDANVFYSEGECHFFDWGDASISHPFISLMVPLRVLGKRLGLKPETHPDLAWAREAYLQSWTEFAPLPDLIAAWELTLRLGRFQRAITWYVVTKTTAPTARASFSESFPGWLQEFVENDP